MELFESPILKPGDLNLKACAFKFLIALILCYNILFYFSLYNSPAVANRLYILLNINIEKLKMKALQLLYSIYSWHCQAKPSSVILLSICIWFGNKNRKNSLLFPPDLNMDFRGPKKKKFIILLSPFLILFQFTLHYF